jgi:hypothetical protein
MEDTKKEVTATEAVASLGGDTAFLSATTASAHPPAAKVSENFRKVVLDPEVEDKVQRYMARRAKELFVGGTFHENALPTAGLDVRATAHQCWDALVVVLICGTTWLALYEV